MDLTAVTQSFKKEKVVTVVLLTTWLSCSVVTARRRLKAWRAYTSYNHNGRYYTLPEIAKFDENGLWWHQGVFFSKHGNLKQTLVYLVTHSEQGLSGSELGVLLGLQPRSFLSHFRDHPALHREHAQGRWVWYSANPKTYERQKQMGFAHAATKRAGMPSDMEAVMILVDLIGHPNSGLEQIADRLKVKGLDIDVVAIRQLLVHHDLLKKTVDFPVSDV
jgi:hypothetical protein